MLGCAFYWVPLFDLVVRKFCQNLLEFSLSEVKNSFKLVSFKADKLTICMYVHMLYVDIVKI